ncbi:MAG: AMP-binding enzyme, partial [Pseudonocardiales bacterium]|nr:AMP-binding enzyme [Pseudonocardiales bacterium]
MSGPTLGGTVRRLAVERAEHTYLWFEGQRVTYAQLGERSSRVAAGLVGAGVTAGDRVAVLSKNSPA